MPDHSLLVTIPHSGEKVPPQASWLASLPEPILMCDKGTTHLVDGSCIEKFNPRVEAYGCVDELNSFLGVVRSCLQKQNETHSLDPLFEKIQNQLFNLGSLLACPTPEIRKKLPAIQENHVRDHKLLRDPRDVSCFRL
jgi:cob(I)alamin adenosyltransferase